MRGGFKLFAHTPASVPMREESHGLLSRVSGRDGARERLQRPEMGHHSPTIRGAGGTQIVRTPSSEDFPNSGTPSWPPMG